MNDIYDGQIYDLNTRVDHAKYMRQLHQLHLKKLVIDRKIRKHQGMMRDFFQKLHAITARRRYIMR